MARGGEREGEDSSGEGDGGNVSGRREQMQRAVMMREEVSSGLDGEEEGVELGDDSESGRRKQWREEEEEEPDSIKCAVWRLGR